MTLKMQPLQYIQAIEQLVARRDFPTAYDRVGRLLSAMAADDERLARWLTTAKPSAVRSLFTRLTASMTNLLVDPAAEVSSQSFQRYLTVMPEISHSFAVGGYGSADHILEAIGGRAQRQADGTTNFANQSDARKFMLCCSIYGKSVAPLIELFRRAPQASLSTLLRSLAAHVTCAPNAQQNRNQLLAAISSGTEVTPSHRMLWDIHRAWTLCSYATMDQKHDVKRHLNHLIVNWLSAQEFTIPQPKSTLSHGDRPTMVVACEVAGGGHVMSRCYEPFLEQLQQKFRVIVVIGEDDLGDEHVPWCDELVKFQWDMESFGNVLETISRHEPDVIYYPCIGMRLWSVIACNVRLAPLQIASLGHPATTHSSSIDYMVGGDTTSGSDQCYSEKLVRLKSPGNLYRLDREQERFPRTDDDAANPIRVATCANMLKLNPEFLATCGRIAEQARRPVEFHFMPNCIGLKLCVARQQVAAVLERQARFRVYPREACADYLRHLSECHVYLSPHPFGGENSTLDAILQGLPVVTLRGDEPHSCLDARVMQTVGLPEWLITSSVDEYVAAAVRLISEEDTRLAITRQLIETDIERLFADEHEQFAGDFVETMWDIYEQARGSRHEARG